TFTVKTGGSDRIILDVYNSNVDGEKQTSNTKYLTFELKVNTIEMGGMTFGDANPFTYSMETELDLVQSKAFKVGEF
ncbi:hypothetical protein BCR32DRAFT_288525, partial [Anaeromyces robustus]